MNIIIDFLMGIGSTICHQLPSRTIYVSNMPLPMCARDTGIYTGIFFSTVFIVIKKRLSSDKPPEIKMAGLFCLLMIPMMFDGITSYLGFRDTNNTIRLFSGVLFGITIPFLLIPTANFKIHGRNSKRVIKNWKELTAVMAPAVVFCVLILKSDFIPWIIVSLILDSSLVFLICRIIYTVMIRTNLVKGNCFYIVLLGITTMVFTFLFVTSNFVLRPLLHI